MNLPNISTDAIVEDDSCNVPNEVPLFQIKSWQSNNNFHEKGRRGGGQRKRRHWYFYLYSKSHTIRLWVPGNGVTDSTIYFSPPVLHISGNSMGAVSPRNLKLKILQRIYLFSQFNCCFKLLFDIELARDRRMTWKFMLIQFDWIETKSIFRLKEITKIPANS